MSVMSKKEIMFENDDELRQFVEKEHETVVKSCNEKKLEENRILMAKNKRINGNFNKRRPTQRRFPKLLGNRDPLPEILDTLYCLPCKSGQRGGNGAVVGAGAVTTAVTAAVTTAAASASANTSANTTASADILFGFGLRYRTTPDAENKTNKNTEMHQHEPPGCHSPPIPSSNPHNDVKEDESRYPNQDLFKIKISKQKSFSSIGPTVWLEGTHQQRPRSTATIFLKTHYATEDEKSLDYVPYFGEDDNEDVVSDCYDVKRREQLVEHGPEHKQLRENIIIDQVLKNIANKTTVTLPILKLLATLMDDEHEGRVTKRWDAIQNSKEDDSTVEEEDKTKKKFGRLENYEGAMDTYSKMLCRRCLIYDCNMHKLNAPSDLLLQYELSTQLERDGYWEELEFDQPQQLVKKVPMSPTLNAQQQAIIPRMFMMYQGNIERIADTAKASKEAVQQFVTEKKLQIPQEFVFVKPEKTTGKRKGKKGIFDQSMNNYSHQLLKKIEEAEIHPYFEPCSHSGPCSRENCGCAQNAFFCTKHCVWGRRSQNFFRGCACNGKCTTKSCSCFAAKRECDPDLCRHCGTCTDPPNQPATTQRCRNDNIGMRRHCHLLMGISTVENAGWGIYTRYPLKKGDFVHEYVGEVISQEEAERRGRIYDKKNRSYLFNLSSDFVVDASRKGNKTRFANHSRKPNCETKYITVNGDMRIGLFAKEDIEAQSELFFDYRYDVSVDNEYIIKPAQNVDWMKDPKMANKISKKSC